MSSGTRAGCFVLCFSPSGETKPSESTEGFLGNAMLCPQAAVEAGAFFGFLFSGTVFAPFLSEVELEDGWMFFSGHEFP